MSKIYALLHSFKDTQSAKLESLQGWFCYLGLIFDISALDNYLGNMI